MCCLFLTAGFPAAEAAQPGLRPGELAEQTKRFVEAARIHRRHLPQIMARRGVVASGVAIDANGNPIVRVYLEDDAVRGVPAMLDGIRVRTAVSGRVYALRQPTCESSGDFVCETTEAWPLPVPTGTSVGHPNITAGTIGARVTDGVNVYALSNNHVLANANGANIGDDVVQPGPFDGGTSDDAIGTLSDFEPIEFCECDFFFFGICFGNKVCPINTMDAAVAVSSPGELGVSTPTGESGSAIGYGTPGATLHPAYGVPTVIGDEDLMSLEGASVQKMGRTTLLTAGVVDAVFASVNVCYDGGCGLEARFDDQIMITPGTFSAGGDSGSLIVTDDAGRHAVGLLFAGSSTHTIANRIDLVLDRFGVTIDEGGGVPTFTDAGIAGIVAPTTQVTGETATVSVTVTNFGNEPIAPQSIAVSLADLSDAGAAISPGLVTVPSELIPGASAMVDFGWTAALAGTHTLEAGLTLAGDVNVDNDFGSTTSNVVDPGLSGPRLQLSNIVASTSAWTTVALDHDYGDGMVVACSPNYDLAATGPALVRIRNASGSSFEVGVARPWFGAFDFEHFSIDVHCMIVQEGVYTQAEHGVEMEAVKLDGFASTDNRNSWNGESQSFLNSYSAPVVVGQVISGDDGLPPSSCPASASNICDPVWSTFWSRGVSRTNPPNASTLFVGRHSGEDTTPRPVETLTYIVIESGDGAIEGHGYSAALGADIVRGMSNNPPQTYVLTDLNSASTAIVSQAAMDGNNGGWAVVYGGGLTSTQLPLSIDEDWYLDSERRHTTEQVAYIVFE